MTCAGGCCDRKDAEQDITVSDQSPSNVPEPSTSIPIETSHRNVDNAVSTEPESESTASLGSCFSNSKPTGLILPSSRCSTAKPLTQTCQSSCFSSSSATQAKSGCEGEISNISDRPTNCTSTEGNGITSSKVDGTGGCCGSKKPKVVEATTPTTESSCCAPKQLSCCTTTPAKSAPTPTTRPCCSTERSSGCSNEKRDVVISTDIKSVDSSTIDMEKSIDTARQHMIISISGMTCTGCETKLQRTLSGLRYVSNVQTSLVLARVELDINGNFATADDIIKHLHRTTEFKCEVISNQGHSLDLVCSAGDAVTWLNSHERPDGVLDVRRVGKEQKTFRVDYDAKVIGARELLEHPWSNALHLAPPCPDASLDAGSKHVRNMGLMTLLSAILTIPVLVMAWAPLPDRNIAYDSASLALATIVQVVVAGPFYPKALKALVFSRVIEMDLLIVLSTSTAYIFSIVSFAYQVSGRPLTTGQFFETSTLLVTLIMVGRWIASLARQKAAESISIRSLQAQTATLVIEKQDADREIDTRLLQFGDVFRVAPHSRIPTDGTVISGSSEIDESMLTGESMPVEKQVGSTVIAGSINGHGTLTVRLTRLPGDNTITTIASMVDKAKLSKPKIQEIADMIASYFVPVVVTLTTITFAIWIAIGVVVRNQSGSRAAIEAITYSITVLIVSCPCAIGLAVPMVIVIASGAAAKRGVVFKSAGSIEIAYRTTDVVFDKTGTLTAGKLAVVREEFLGDDGVAARSLLLGLLGSMTHPVSAAIAEHLASQKVSPLPVTNAKVVTGKGVEASHNGRMLRAGNCRWLGLSEHPYAGILLSEGFSTFCFVVDDTPVAIFGLRDTLRLDAASTVRRLYKAGINVHIISGDDEGAVRDIATQLDVKEETVRSRCSPSDKQAYINELLAGQSATSSSSKRCKPCKPVVMFVGDGTNDAVALAQATIGVHISSGTDVAQSAADVVLVRPDLSEVLTIISISRKAIHRVAFNFGWSFVYNLFAVLLGAGAFVHARIPPEFAGLGELVSVLPVVLAAVSLKWSHV